MERSPPLSSEMLCNCLPGGLAVISMPVERVALIQQRQVRAPAAEEFREHFPKIDSHLGKGFAKQLSGGGVDLRDHIEQLATRICKIIIWRFEKFVSLVQLVVLMNSLEVYRAHVVELRAKIRDDFLKINVAEVDRVLRTRWQIRRGFAAICSIARGAVDPPFRLRAQNFLERGL